MLYVRQRMDGTVVRSTVPNTSTGAFFLARLAPGNYDVVITADSHATAVIDAVPVASTTSVVAVSSNATPLTLPVSASRNISGTVTLNPSGGVGTFDGRALAKAAVTITGGTLTGCTGGSLGGTAHPKCNQGVGNGPENCDPGNSNQGNPLRSNDELGGVPGAPGRQGGNN